MTAGDTKSVMLVSRSNSSQQKTNSRPKNRFEENIDFKIFQTLVSQISDGHSTRTEKQQVKKVKPDETKKNTSAPKEQK